MTEHHPHRAETRIPTPSRRALARGAAWAVPTLAVATAAPAFASSCLPTTVATNWTSAAYTRLSTTSGRYTVADPDGTGPRKGIALSIASTFGSNTQPGAQLVADNGGDQLVGQLDVRGGMSGTLALHQSPRNNDGKAYDALRENCQVVTFTFTEPVRDLRFTIGDVDSQINDFADRVVIDSSAAWKSTPYTDLVKTEGTAMYASSEDTRVDNSSTNGNVDIRFSQPVKTFTLTYYNVTKLYGKSADGKSIDGDQRIFLSPFTFTYDPCPPK